MLETLDTILSKLDGVAGLAAFVNGLLLWPIVRTLRADKESHDLRLNNHETRITKLEPK